MVVVSVEVVVASPFFFTAMWCGVVCRAPRWAPNCWWRVLPERTNTTTVKKERTSRSEQLQARNEASHSKLDSLSIFKCVPSMHRGRVFIGDGSPNTLRYYTVMPPNNYIPGIFPGTTIFLHHLVNYIRASSAHWAHYSPLGPLQDSLRGFRSAYSPTPSLLVFDFAVGALVFASLRFSSSSPVANRSSP